MELRGFKPIKRKIKYLCGVHLYCQHLGGLTQEDHEFKSSLSYIMKVCL